MYLCNILELWYNFTSYMVTLGGHPWTIAFIKAITKEQLATIMASSLFIQQLRCTGDCIFLPGSFITCITCRGRGRSFQLGGGGGGGGGILPLWKICAPVVPPPLTWEIAALNSSWHSKKYYTNLFSCLYLQDLSFPAIVQQMKHLEFYHH